MDGLVVVDERDTALRTALSYGRCRAASSSPPGGWQGPSGMSGRHAPAAANRTSRATVVQSRLPVFLGVSTRVVGVLWFDGLGVSGLLALRWLRLAGSDGGLDRIDLAFNTFQVLSVDLEDQVLCSEKKDRLEYQLEPFALPVLEGGREERRPEVRPEKAWPCCCCSLVNSASWAKNWPSHDPENSTIST